MGMCVSVSSGKASLRHDQREYKEGKSPKNIDESRGHLNEYYVRCDTTLEQAFNDFFKDSLDEYNAKQTRTDRKKENYYDELKHSKNKETPLYEYVFQIGNKDNVQGLPDEEKVVDCLREYAEHFEEKNPNFHVVYCVLHRDEATPHLHMGIVPWAEGYKTGLSMRCSTSKALESMGYKGQERNMKSWKHTQEDELEKLMQKRGLEREVLHTTRGRVDTEVYKETKDRALADVKPELDRLTAEIAKKEKTLSRINREIMDKKIDKKKLNEEWKEVYYDVQNIESDKEFAQKQLAKTTESIEDAKTEIAGLQKEVAELKRQQESVGFSLGLKKKMSEHLSQEVEYKQDRIEMLNREIDKAEQKLPELQGRIKEKEDELRNLPSIEEKKAELQHTETLLAFKTKQLDQRQKNLETANELYEHKAQSIVRLDNDIETKKAELASIPSPETYRQKSTEARRELLGLQGNIDSTRKDLKSVQADLERCRANQLDLLKKNGLLEQEQRELINGWTDKEGNKHPGINQLKAFRTNLNQQIQEAKQTLQELSGNIRGTIRSIFAEAIEHIRGGVEIAQKQSFGKDTNFTVAMGMEKIEKDGHDRADRELHKSVSDPVKEKLTEEVNKAEKQIADTVQNYVPHRRRGR